MPNELILSLTINGEPVRRLVPTTRTLLDFLREDLDLTGSKHGCEVGDCGACTVLVDDLPMLACITLAADCEGRRVRTIESVAAPTPHPVQVAFDQHVAAQCGYCTPGIVMTLVSLLEQDPHPDDATIRHHLGSNLCRCTGYTKILDAARQAAGRPKEA